MPFIEDMQGRDLTLLQTLDGRAVIYTPQGGSAIVISGMLQAMSEISGAETVDIVTARPVLSIRSIDAPTIQEGDGISVDGTDYEVAVIQPDNEGITELILEKL
jgi:hypothetical protein